YWMFSNRPSYASPYGGGHYPAGYGGGWTRKPTGQYTADMSGRSATSTFNRSTTPAFDKSVGSPKAQTTAPRRRAIANPTQSQRSFSKRTGRAPARAGGFGRSSSSGSSRSGGFSGGGK